MFGVYSSVANSFDGDLGFLFQIEFEKDDINLGNVFGITGILRQSDAVSLS